MADGYRIEAQVLHEVVSGLDRGASALDEAAAGLPEAPVSDLGTAELDAVAAQLVAHWTNAVANAHAAVIETGEGVRTALAGYTDTEQWIADLFTSDTPE